MLGVERSAGAGELLHLTLFLGADRLQPEIDEGAELPAAVRKVEAAREVLKLGAEVDDPGRHRPAERQDAADFGARVVSEKEVVGPGAVRARPGAFDVDPFADGPAADYVAGDDAKRHGMSALGRGKLEVDAPNGSPGMFHAQPLRRLMTG